MNRAAVLVIVEFCTLNSEVNWKMSQSSLVVDWLPQTYGNSPDPPPSFIYSQLAMAGRGRMKRMGGAGVDSLSSTP